MSANLTATALVIATAALSAPAVASGFGPAPSYNPKIGAPSSQRGPNAQTVATMQQSVSFGAFGNGSGTRSNSGKRSQPDVNSVSSKTSDDASN